MSLRSHNGHTIVWKASDLHHCEICGEPAECDDDRKEQTVWNANTKIVVHSSTSGTRGVI